MKLPVIKKLVESYTLDDLRLAESQVLDDEKLTIDVDGEDEGEKLTHILAAIEVLHRVKHENIDNRVALREFFERVRSSIS
jgi:hypothetical protein